VRNLLPAILLGAFGFGSSAHCQSPYADEKSREIKSLSRQDVESYLQGHGMGYAKAAELNHYPGPRHVLDLARELGLTAEQTNQSQAIFDRMQAQAMGFGSQLVQRETELERLFADGSIDSGSLDKLVTDIARLEGRIRFVHLSAHLEQRASLSAQQAMLYDRLRGYNRVDGNEHNHEH
jgi:Spy/CpxP family protein refolding chaperone